MAVEKLRCCECLEPSGYTVNTKLADKNRGLYYISYPERDDTRGAFYYCTTCWDNIHPTIREQIAT
jgi:hypothetical protein